MQLFNERVIGVCADRMTAVVAAIDTWEIRVIELTASEYEMLSSVLNSTLNDGIAFDVELSAIAERRAA